MPQVQATDRGRTVNYNWFYDGLSYCILRWDVPADFVAYDDILRVHVLLPKVPIR